MKTTTFLLLALLVAAGCRTKGPAFDPSFPQEADAPDGVFTAANLTNRLDPALLIAPTDPYRLGPGDIIDIEVIGEAKSHIAVTVGPDGKIYYNLLPGTSVWGLSLAETRALLQREMAKYTRAMPELSINVRAVGSKRVWLLGAVASPGVYALGTPTSLLDVLSSTVGGAVSSGVDDGADLSRSFVLRDGKRLPVDFERLLKRGDLSQNIFLQPDDFVFVRPTDLPNIYILGAVNAPRIAPYTRDLTVGRALITSGGLVKYAQSSRVVIIRGGLTEPKIAQLDYNAIVTGKSKDLRLQPGDIVYVPFSPFRRLAQLTEDVLDQFVRTVAVNEGTYVVNGQNRPVGISAPGFGGISTPGQR